MQYAIWKRQSSIFQHVLGVWLLLLLLCQHARLLLQKDGILVDLTLIRVVLLGVFEHHLHVPHEVVDRLILFPLGLPLDQVHGHWVLDLDKVLWHRRLVGQPLEVAHLHLTVGSLDLAETLDDSLDARLQRRIDPRWSAAFPSRVGFVGLAVVVSAFTDTVAFGGGGTWSASLASAFAILVRVVSLVVFVVLVIVVVIFSLVVDLPGRTRRDLSEIGKDGQISRDELLLDELFEFRFQDRLEKVSCGMIEVEESEESEP